MAVTVTFHGTRGSVPTPGPATLRYGGNTPCITIRSGSDLLILDAGTGIRAVGRQLLNTPPSEPIRILLSHTHWDHIQGLPFFAPLFRALHRVEIFGPAPERGSLAQVLESQMSASVFPVELTRAGAELTVTELSPGSTSLGGYRVETVLLLHPARTLGFRIHPPGAAGSVAYLTDNELGAADPQRWQGLVRFLHGSTLLIHDAMYLEAEGAGRSGWGHSTGRQAADLAIAAGCHHLALFHHDPERDDDQLELVLAEARSGVRTARGTPNIFLAREGAAVDLT